MASIKVKFRTSATACNEGMIYYQIIHKRKVRLINTAYRIKCEEWDKSRSTISVMQSRDRMLPLTALRERIGIEVERLVNIDKRLKAGTSNYTADDVVSEFHRFEKEYSLAGYMNNLITRLRYNGNIRTSETYISALNSFMRYLASTPSQYYSGADTDIMLDCLTSDLIEGFAAWHRQQGHTPNTISFYTRILRAVYNRAVERGIIENRHPFRRVYTGVEKTVKRALPLSVIKKINGLSLDFSKPLMFARDMFMMSFYLRGMSFIDMSFLKKTDLRNGHITYRRRKTGQQLSIKWTSEMQAILDKYPANPTRYLLPIIRTEGANELYAYRNVGYNINHNLKKIALMVGISIPLTMYVARHSWASVAKAKGVSLSVISEGLGHDSEATTQIYLASLDTSAVDRANALILKSL